jgi:hypothetical protein
MELAAGVLVNYFLVIKEVLQLMGEGESTSWHLCKCKLPECDQVAGLSVVSDKNPSVIVAEVSVDEIGKAVPNRKDRVCGEPWTLEHCGSHKAFSPGLIYSLKVSLL